MTMTSAAVGIIFVVTSVFRCTADRLNQQPFPKDFLFGASSAAYQIEGAWNLSGKGESIWDKYTHEYPERIYNGDNGDVACDSYHKYKEDVQLAVNLNLNFYRFSISWSRILPTGYPDKVNPDGIRYYNALIDELLANGIEPMVTIYHWDLPTALQDIGGWPSCSVITYFVDFARIVFQHFGDRVKKWITFNEPRQFCKLGYGIGVLAPGYETTGIGDYLCSHTLLLAHARVYHMYKSVFKPKQKGLVGFTINVNWGEPNTTSQADVDAADRIFEFRMGMYANPIYGSGDYPQIVKRFIGERSKKQGFPNSRLPRLSALDVRLLRGSADFFGLNSYTTNIVANSPEEDLSVVSWDSDARVNYWQNENLPGGASTWLKIVPWGMRKILHKIKQKYGSVPIYITENGYSDEGGLNDITRSNFILTYLSNVLDAIHIDKVNVKAYSYWSLLDNFEWTDGYRARFGLHYVDFTNPNRPRSAKRSAGVYRDVIKSKKLPANTIPTASKRMDFDYDIKFNFQIGFGNTSQIHIHDERN